MLRIIAIFVRNFSNMSVVGLDNEYERCVEMLCSIAPSFQKVGTAGYHPGLETMSDFSDFLGNPHKGGVFVHIAGTNGKGSVAHMLASVLAFSRPGSVIGLYTSPHLLDFRERIRTVSSEPDSGGRYCREIGKDEVVDFVCRCRQFIEDRRPSFFEITTAMAFDYFRRHGVDAAVIETGLGGRLDSTNIIMPELSIITSIGLDHKDILGDTISSIAYEKCGIIKPGVPVVAGYLPDEAMRVVESVAGKRGCRLYRSSDTYGGSPVVAAAAKEADLGSDCQSMNIATVFTALRVLRASEVSLHDEVFRAVTHAAHISGLRGRWERLSVSPEVICDIGHNVEALSVSMKQLVKEAGDRHIIMVYGMAGDKDVASVVELLPSGASYVLTQAEGSRAMPAADLKTLLDRSMLRRGMRQEELDSVDVPDVGRAVDIALERASDKDIVFIGGSSYVVAEAVAHFLHSSARSQ